MTNERSIFDILGPVMIGPSSSHTAGAVRLGLMARAIYGAQPDAARIVLHGSFASTGRGHGTDLALVAGLLGEQPDDPAIVHALETAEDAGMAVSIETGDLGDVHPNTARFELSGPNGPLTVEGSSTGGGEVLVTCIGEFRTEATGRMPLLLVAHTDQPGEIAAVTHVIAEDGVNIAEMRVSRTRRGSDALMLIETDAPVSDQAVAEIATRGAVTNVRRVPPV